MRTLAGGSSDSDHVPVIALTRHWDLKTRVASLNSGADDILQALFEAEELLARVIAVLRRTYQREVPLVPAVRFGELEIDITKRLVMVGDLKVHLTSLEEAILYVLVGNAGRVLSREEICQAVWGIALSGRSNKVDRHIRSLRKKLQNSHKKPRYIFTVPRKGYMFRATTSEAA